ncbi:hypothetical protein BU16DRAFT_529446 [Lophium mytilinum]|uniref:Uncharacterized protein n=1 Tax=Lophium mytilinum TaxID=390894 RepID=A0A6A6QJ89_9PEZI|nr:hypothetical protein BU16DRAFT_529446 [Lophium mytilinum]
MYHQISSALSALSLFTAAFAAPTSFASRSAYPFNQLVAFGDEFSDNGNGSYAHGITGDPANVYGFGTWTNGPVAVSYLTDLLKVPMRDFAFGGCCGGSSGGATFDNAYTKSGAGAPSLVDQINNYTTGPHSNIKKALQFIWVGQNDVSAHTDAFWEGDPKNSQFAANATDKTVASVKKLLNGGAPYVFVSNIYPKHIAPVTAKYLCGTDAGCVTTWGNVIQKANDALKAGLTQFGSKVIYYDSFTFVSDLAENAAANGFTKPLTSFCDGDGDAAWNDCMVQKHADEYFWMNFVQPTTRVHQLIAKDMKATIDKHFA